MGVLGVTEYGCVMKVYLSHAQSDERLAARVSRILEDAGLQVWDATREIMPGDNWAATLGNALQESQAMVVLVTPDAMRSKWVRWEIEYALGQIRFRERLIPVVAGDPDDLEREDVPWILRRLKMIKLADHGNEEEGIREVARTLLQVA